MRKVVWLTFGIALVLVNLIAVVGEHYTGIHVHMLLRIALIVGVTTGMSVLMGARILINKLEEEKPLSGYTSDTLSADRKKSS